MYGTDIRFPGQGAMWVDAMEWCRGPVPPRDPSLVRLGGWPTAIIALVISAHSLPGCNWKYFAGRMIKASPMFAAFEWQLNARAAVADRLPTVVATIALESVNTMLTTGLSRQMLLKISLAAESDAEERPSDVATTKWFDVFDWNTSRGVCEVLMCEEDVPFLKKGHASLCVHDINTGLMECASRQVTNLAEVPTLVTRNVTDEEASLILRALGSPARPSDNPVLKYFIRIIFRINWAFNSCYQFFPFMF